MSLGQTAEATTAHLGKQAAPRPGHLRLPQTWLFNGELQSSCEVREPLFSPYIALQEH